MGFRDWYTFSEQSQDFLARKGNMAFPSGGGLHIISVGHLDAVG